MAITAFPKHFILYGDTKWSRKNISELLDAFREHLLFGTISITRILAMTPFTISLPDDFIRSASVMVSTRAEHCK